MIHYLATIVTLDFKEHNLIFYNKQASGHADRSDHLLNYLRGQLGHVSINVGVISNYEYNKLKDMPRYRWAASNPEETRTLLLLNKNLEPHFK
jgi:hypothetical protein